MQVLTRMRVLFAFVAVVAAAVIIPALWVRIAPAGFLENRTFDVVAANPESLGEFGQIEVGHQPADYIRVTFDTLKQIDVNAANCPYISGNYSVRDGRLATWDLRPLLIGCGPVEDDTSWWFARLLASSPTVVAKGNDVVLTSSEFSAVLRDHSEPVQWTVAPGFPFDGPTRTLHVNVLEWACASAQTPQGRILPPRIEYDADAIYISIRIKTLASATCPGNAPYLYTFDLSQPVGDRTLIDSDFPPS